MANSLQLFISLEKATMSYFLFMNDIFFITGVLNVIFLLYHTFFIVFIDCFDSFDTDVSFHIKRSICFVVRYSDSCQNEYLKNLMLHIILARACNILCKPFICSLQSCLPNNRTSSTGKTSSSGEMFCWGTSKFFINDSTHLSSSSPAHTENIAMTCQNFVRQKHYENVQRTLIC